MKDLVYSSKEGDTKEPNRRKFGIFIIIAMVAVFLGGYSSLTHAKGEKCPAGQKFCETFGFCIVNALTCPEEDDDDECPSDFCGNEANCGESCTDSEGFTHRCPSCPIDPDEPPIVGPPPVDPPPGETPPPVVNPEEWTNTVSRPDLQWQDSSGRQGAAEATFGHVGCRDQSCQQPSVWPNVFNGFGGKWIWKKRMITPDEAQRGDIVSFYDRFCLPQNGNQITTVNLIISADNSYEAYYVDGNRQRTSGVLARDDEWRTVDGHLLPIPDLAPGECQGFEILVANFGVSGSDGNNNPAGLSYDLRTQYTTQQ